MACRGGLAMYDRSEDHFYNCTLRYKEQSVNFIQFVELGTNKFLCMTSAHGLLLFDEGKRTFQSIQTPLIEKGYFPYLHRSRKNGELYSISNGYVGQWNKSKQNLDIVLSLDSQQYIKGDPVINGIYEDSTGVCWIYRTDGTLYLYSVTRNTLLKEIRLKNPPINDFSLNKPPIVFEGKFWIPTGVNGLFVLDTATGAEAVVSLKEHYSSDPNQELHLSSDRVFSLLADRSGNLWVGTFGGIYKYVPSKTKFTKVTSFQSGQGNTIPLNRILHFLNRTVLPIVFAA